MIQQVTRDLRRAIVAIHNGEDVDAATIEELLTRGERNAASASDADIRALLETVQGLEALVRDRYEEVGEDLRRLGQGRQALKGYHHLRGASEGQRLYRRA
jgi:hypothetical protein